ncbi:hypothetical protein DTL42_21715 [Bremerella cremea]|uniref:Uncharacterized protein n=1 Tax=Bremerella cremea TaxID=1031537 RepID=A0A368KK93_9BACT|nr:hypothetical protein [Bremerella cremea]RCS41191.1 hypothetical protein DTL42_21715 [Bremerella cremea]
MSSETSPETEIELETVDERPQQFRLLDMMIGMTIVAIVCALMAPLFRMMVAENRLPVFIIFLVQAMVTAGAIFYASSRRQKMLVDAGKRIGLGYNGRLPGKFWPQVVNFGAMAFLAVMQFGLTLFLAMDSFPWFLMAQQIQLGIYSGMMLSQFRWGRTPGTTEFFEQGVVLGGFHLVPWSYVVLRPSKMAEDRLVMVMKSQSNSIGGTTSTIQVSDSLRDYLLTHHGEAA